MWGLRRGEQDIPSLLLSGPLPIDSTRFLWGVPRPQPSWFVTMHPRYRCYGQVNSARWWCWPCEVQVVVAVQVAADVAVVVRSVLNKLVGKSIMWRGLKASDKH